MELFCDPDVYVESSSRVVSTSIYGLDVLIEVEILQLNFDCRGCEIWRTLRRHGHEYRAELVSGLPAHLAEPVWQDNSIANSDLLSIASYEVVDVISQLWWERQECGWRHFQGL